MIETFLDTEEDTEEEGSEKEIGKVEEIPQFPALGSPEARKQFVKDGGLEKLLVEIEKVEDQQELASKCLLLRMFSSLKPYSRKLGKLRAARPILKIVTEHLQKQQVVNLSIILPCLEAISKINTFDARFPVYSRLFNTIPVLISFLQSYFAEKPEIICLIFSVLIACLKSSSVNSTAFSRSGGISVISPLIFNHINEKETLQTSLKLLSSISLNSACKKLLWQEKSLMEKLFNLIAVLRDDSQMLVHLCSVLIFLLDGQPLKNGLEQTNSDIIQILMEITEKSIKEDCFSKLSRCLTTLLMKIVCTRGRISPFDNNFERIVDILPNELSDEQNLNSRKSDLLYEQLENSTAIPQPNLAIQPLSISRKILKFIHHEIDIIRSNFQPYIVFDSENQQQIQKDETSLIFESRFESGNLLRAIRIAPNEYELVTSFDTNVKFHTQWFYFSVSGMEIGVNYRFNIVNLEKSTSEYCFGLKPLVFSEKLFQTQNIGWTHDCANVCYYSNRFINQETGKQFSTLTFTKTFEISGDTVFFASCYPYTYSDLKRFISNTFETNKPKGIIHITTLCKTLGGNSCDLITITNFNSPKNDIAKRKYVLITSRVHPGEAQSSFVVEGFIEFILGDSLEAKQLREKFIFKIIPMLNPDGVIEGNNRCSLWGIDLNRSWKEPTPEKTPTIFATKWLMKQIVSTSNEIFLFVDLHGHSRKKNVFVYGCRAINKDQPFSERIFPFILSKRFPHCVSFESCSFKIPTGAKKGCGRFVIWQEFGVLNSFTIESSFSGMDVGQFKGNFLNQSLLRLTGTSIGFALFDYYFKYCLQDNHSFASQDLLSEFSKINHKIE